MSNTIENIVNKIEANKEVLEALPKNTKKNIEVYLSKIEELQSEYVQIEKAILGEMKKRYDKAMDIQENEEISKIEQSLNNTEGILYLLNEIDTSYEKMDLDKAIHKLSFFYKRNLEVLNENIFYCLKKLKQVGIEIKEDDIAYNKYAKKYLSICLNEMEDEDSCSQKLNKKIEEIYWKCPNIITYVQLNIRYLYLKNEKKIDKYYEKQKEKLLEKFSREDILNSVKDLKGQLLALNKQDSKDIIENFMSGKLAFKDYSRSMMNAKYAKFVGKELAENANENELNEFEVNLEKLSKSLYEYKNYLKFKFIIDDVKRIYSEKDKYKNIYAQTLKEISTLENKIIKLDKTINGIGLFKKPNEKHVTEQDNLISELKNLYKKLDLDKVYNKIATELNDGSTIEDVLCLANSFYNYLFDCVKNNFTDLQEEGIDDFIKELKEFIRWPHRTIINNIKIQEDKNILLIIKDRYKLLNINVTKDDLAADNLDTLMSILDSISINHSIRANNINLEELGNIYELKKILDKQ